MKLCQWNGINRNCYVHIILYHNYTQKIITTIVQRTQQYLWHFDINKKQHDKLWGRSDDSRNQLLTTAPLSCWSCANCASNILRCLELRVMQPRYASLSRSRYLSLLWESVGPLHRWSYCVTSSRPKSPCTHSSKPPLHTQHVCLFADEQTTGHPLHTRTRTVLSTDSGLRQWDSGIYEMVVLSIKIDMHSQTINDQPIFAFGRKLQLFAAATRVQQVFCTQ